MSSSRESNSLQIVPPRPVEVQALESIARIDASLQRLANWGVKIPRNCRLHKARSILEEVSATRLLTPNQRGDSLGLQSLELALDYDHISQTLPLAPVSAVRRELRDSLSGEIDPPTDNRGPAQLQSQAVVRAAFVRAGVQPRHPTLSPNKGITTPDLLLDNGTLSYAVEAKRPQALKNVLPRFKDANDQLRSFGVSGAVVIDVADCVRGFERSDAEAAVFESAQRVIDEVLVKPGAGRKGHYAHLMVTVVYARIAWTVEDYADHAMTSVHLISRASVYANARNTLADHRAKWLRSTFSAGLRSLTEPLRPAA